MSTNKLTRLKHLSALATRTKAELTALDTKIQEIVTVGGQPNVIETIKVNGTPLTVTDKAVDISIVHPEYSLVKAADSGEYASVYNLTKDGEIVGASINIPKDLVVKSGSVNAEGNIVLVLNDEANTEIVIDAKSLIEYVTSGSAAGDMIVINVSDDHKVTATITDGTITLAKLADEVKNAWDAKGSAATAEQNAKDYADGLAGNYDAKGAAATAEQNAKDYADGLADDYDAAGSAAAAEAAAKAYADGLAGNYDAKGAAATAEQNAKSYAGELNTAMDTRMQEVEGKKHEHANKTVLDGITATQVTAWDAAEQNAKDYADGLAGNYDASGSAAQALTDAKAYVDGMIATDEEVTAAIDAVFGAQA